MKTIKHLFTALLLLCATVATAHDFEVDGIYYDVTDATNKTVAVTYRGDYSSSYSNEYTGSMIIPESVSYNNNVYSVTSIGGEAFSYCTGLTSIVIPNSVTRIGGGAFRYCSGLTSIEIPNSVTSIGNSAFYGCTGLTSVEIPNSVTSIEDDAFYKCSGLTSITIPNSVTSIGRLTFSQCTSLTTVEIPNSITSIGEYAFDGCSGLTSITIPNSVTSIYNNAFAGCASLKTLHFDDGAETLNLGYNYNTSYHDGLFNDCPLETLYLGRNISYNISKYYGYSPFYNKATLKSITISDSVTSINGYAFSGCSGLTSVVIPNSITSIANTAFEGCSILKLELNCTTIRDWFKDCTSIKGLVIGDNVTKIESGAFFGCSELKSVTIGKSVTTIPQSMFSKCSALQTLIIPEGVTSIGNYAFSGCSGLKSIVIPNSVTRIGYGAFQDCSNLKKLKIPGNVKSIEDHAFDKCGMLNHIVFEAGNDTLHIGYRYSNNEGLFEQCKIDTLLLNRNIKFNRQYYGAFYKSEASKRLKFVEIGDSVTYIPDNLFYECQNIVSFKIGKNLSFIGKNGFHSCSGLEALQIGHSTTKCTIGEYAFAGCEDLKTVHINNAVIEHGAFYGCISLDKLTLNDKVTTIESYAFYKCTSLEELNTGNGVRSVEDYAFSGCTGLKEIILGKRLNYIGNGVFGNCENIETIYALPKRAINCNESNPTNVFSDKVYKYATLLVKEDAIDSYDTTEPWSKFYIEPIGDFTLTYMVDGEVYKKEKYEYDSAITPLALPEKEGHTFSGWSEIPETMPAEDITVTGSFSVNSYDVTFVVDGEVYQTVRMNYGETITLPEEPTKEGHTFSGWDEIPETMPARDVVIEGSFAVNSYNVVYIVDGEEYKRESVVYGTAITLPGEPTKEGYTFSGWSGIPETMPAEDITVTGSFSVNSYDVTFVVDEEVYKTVSVNYGETIPVPEEPVKDGCTFSGWSEIPATMPAEDITITGSFYANYYTLTYMVDGEVYATVTVGYNAVIPEMEEPTKEGHTFSGWENVPERMPAQDITIIGSFTVNSYNAIFLVDNALYAMLSVNYGEAIELPEPPSKEGFVFDGWEGLPVTMPAKDIVLIAIFTDVTGVDDVKSEIGKVKIIYDLNGRAVENPTNGIYVVDGKKVLIK